LVDLVAQRVGAVLLDGVGELGSSHALRAQAAFDLLALFRQLPAGDDIAIHLGGDLFHHAHRLRLGRGSAHRRPAKYYKLPKHIEISILATAGCRRGRPANLAEAAIRVPLPPAPRSPQVAEAALGRIGPPVPIRHTPPGGT